MSDQNLRAKDMPVREEEGVLIRIFSGSSGGIQSTTKNYVCLLYTSDAADE